MIDIVLRNKDLDYWDSCVAELEDPSETRRRMVSIGSPGIGKSTTALFLIRKLLMIGKTVVYRMKGEGVFIQFKPNREFVSVADDVDVEGFPETTLEWDIASLMDRATYFIVDPGITKVNCNPPLRVLARVIIVASPDERHWGGNSFPKVQPGHPGGMYRYFPPWSLVELQAAVQELPSPAQPQEIERLFHIFGGVPQHVLHTSQAEENRQELEQKIKALTQTQAQNLVSGLFAIHANFGADQPQGGITIFTPENNYKSVSVTLASESVRNWVRTFFMNNIWSDLALYPTHTAWQILESYMMEALMRTNQYKVRRCVGKSDAGYLTAFHVQLGGCTSKSLQLDCTNAVLNGIDDVLYYSSDTSHPLYDMIFKRGTVFYAFQVTIGSSHDSKRTLINAVASRLLLGPGQELRLYYAVHEAKFDSFVKNPVQPPSPQGVSIYHLCLRQSL